MRVVTPIVEGDGEVAALPVLLRRIGAWLSPAVPVTIAQPIRVRRDRFLNRDEEVESDAMSKRCGYRGCDPKRPGPSC